jgi:hypothetical protein
MTLWMMVLNTGAWLLKCVFSCNHARTTVNEGKCYCPDCGRGLIYQWVVLRCRDCRVRRDSHYRLRRVMPVQRCCPQCGDPAWWTDYLDSPSYFHLYKARLMVREEQDYLQTPAFWSLYTLSETVNRSVEQTVAKTRTYLALPSTQTS